MDRVLTESYQRIIPEIQQVGVEVTHPGLHTPILIPFGDAERNTLEMVMRVIEQVQQSCKELKFDEGLLVTVTTIEYPWGTGEISFHC